MTQTWIRDAVHRQAERLRIARMLLVTSHRSFALALPRVLLLTQTHALLAVA
jgi:hypothetical protein